MKITLKTMALAAASLPVLAFSQGASLTGKTGSPLPTSSSAPLIDFIAVAQLAVALGIVGALLKWGMPWVMKKMKSDSSSKGTIQVLESVSLGAAQLQLVKAMDRTLLIGVTAQSTRLISDLTEASPTTMASALAIKPEAETIPAPPTSKIDVRVDEDDRVFFEMIDEAMEDEPAPQQVKRTRRAPAKAVITREIIEDEPTEDMTFQEALALIQAAKKRSGLEPVEPVPAAKPKTRLPDPAKAAKAGKPTRTVVKTAALGEAPVQELTEREIQDALDRIKRLSR